MMPDNLLSVAAAAELLGVSTSTLRAWAAEGRVPYTTTAGGHRRFSRTDLAALVAAGLHPGKRSRSTVSEVQAAKDRLWREVIARAMRAAARDLGEDTPEGRRWRARADDLDRS